jgi:hypothetical protein
MPALKTEKEVKGFLGRLNYIAWFISQMITTCEPIFWLIQKKNPRLWNGKCHETFDKISSICRIQLCWCVPCLVDYWFYIWQQLKKKWNVYSSNMISLVEKIEQSIIWVKSS